MAAVDELLVTVSSCCFAGHGSTRRFTWSLEVSSTRRENGIFCRVRYAYTCVGLELVVSLGLRTRLDLHASSKKVKPKMTILRMQKSNAGKYLLEPCSGAPRKVACLLSIQPSICDKGPSCLLPIHCLTSCSSFCLQCPVRVSIGRRIEPPLIPTICP